MGFGTALVRNVRIAPEETGPSKTTALLMAAFHRDDVSDMMESYDSISALFMVLNSAGPRKIPLAQSWFTIAKMKGMCKLLASIPVARVKQISEARALFDNTTDERRMANVYLISRSVTLASIPMRAAFMTLRQVLVSGKMLTSLKNKHSLMTGRMFRAYRVYESIAANIHGLRPFTYAHRVRKAYSWEVNSCSILDLSYKSLLRIATESISYENYVASKKVSESTGNQARARHLFSSMRKEWTAHYENRMVTFLQAAIMTYDLDKTTSFRKHDNMESSTDIQVNLYCMVNEYLVLLGRALAFRFARITFPIATTGGLDSLNHTVNAYRELLNSVSRQEAIGGITVDMKMGQWDNNSYLMKHAVVKLKELTNEVDCLKPHEQYLMNIVKAEYSFCNTKVIKSVKDAVRRDWDITHSNILATSDPGPAVEDTPEESPNVGPLEDSDIVNMMVSSKTVEVVDKFQVEWANYVSMCEAISAETKHAFPRGAGIMESISKVDAAPLSLIHSDRELYESFKLACISMMRYDSDDMAIELEYTHLSVVSRVAERICYTNSRDVSVMG